MHGYVTVNYFLFRTNTRFMSEIKGRRRERVREREERTDRETKRRTSILKDIVCVIYCEKSRSR